MPLPTSEQRSIPPLVTDDSDHAENACWHAGACAGYYDAAREALTRAHELLAAGDDEAAERTAQRGRFFLMHAGAEALHATAEADQLNPVHRAAVVTKLEELHEAARRDQLADQLGAARELAWRAQQERCCAEVANA